MITEQCRHRAPVRGCDAGEQHVLLRRHDHVQAELGHGGTQRGAQSAGNAAGGDGNAEPPGAAALFVPAEQVGHGERGHREQRRERPAEILADAVADPVLAHVVEDVFQAGALAVAAVAVVALQADHGFGDGQEVLRADRAHERCQARIGVSAVVGHAKAAADRDIVAE